jgi:hypothetical protein
MTRFRIAALTTVALLLLLSVAAAAVASSQFTQSSNVKLTATKAGATSGFTVAIKSSDPGEPGGKPQALKTLTITLPSATKFNFKSKSLKLCTASETEILGTGGAACPSKSRLGTGGAEANAFPAIPLLQLSATAYAGNGNIIIVLKGSSGLVLALHGVVSANKVTTTLKPLALAGVPVVVTGLTLKVNKIGSAKNAFITAGKCTGGKFKVKSHFVYQTGSPLTLPSSSSCK